MSFRIKLCTDTEDLDDLFRLRHRVFVDQEKLMPPTPDGRLFNRFDVFPNTVNLVAVSEGTVVGGVRLTRGNDAGNPAKEFFDFGNMYRDTPNGALLYCSMLCVEPQYRKKRELTNNLLRMVTYYAFRHGIERVLAPVRPTLVKRLKTIGFREAAETFTHAESGLIVVPMALDMREINPHYLDFAKTHNIQQYVENYERAFYTADEAIVREGDTGEEAFYIVEGEADVIRACNRTGDSRLVGQLKTGDLFGEVALIVGQRRSATVVARSNIDLMVINRDAFHRQVLDNPNHLFSLLKVVGHRLNQTLSQIHS